MKKLVLSFLLLAGGMSGQQLSTESRAVLVETLQHAAQANRLHAVLIPESRRYFEGRAEAYEAAALVLRDHREPPLPSPPRPVNGRIPLRKKKS